MLLHFTHFLCEDGPHVLRFLFGVVVSPEKYRNVGFPFCGLCMVRQWIQVMRQLTEPLSSISHISFVSVDLGS